MGRRDWLYLVAGGCRGDGRMPRPSTRREVHDDTSTGCTCAVFQLFDFQVPLNHSSNFQLPSDPHLQHLPANTSTGMEAPANTLELKKPLAAMEEQENLNLPVGFRIKTRVSSSDSHSRTEDLSTDCSAITSPGTKTPNLVARLMGLDFIPECSSPSLSSSNSGHSVKSLRKDRNLLQVRTGKNFSEDDVGVGVRSLPETPRMSSARRSDSEYHRLSLQINRENVKQDFKLPGKYKIGARGRFTKQVQDENRNPGHYAKQIVKQIKESVSRRVGLDITNLSNGKHPDIIRKDGSLILPKPAKRSTSDSPKLGETVRGGKQSPTPSWSPPLRLFDTNRSKDVTNSGNKKPRISTSSSDNHQPPGSSNSSKQNFQVTTLEEKQQRDVKKFGSGKSCSSIKKIPHQTYDQAIRKKKEEPYVHPAATNKANLLDKKSKKAPLSNELVNTRGPILLPLKKHPSPATKLSRKQVSSKTRHSYKQLHLQSDKIFAVVVETGKTSRCAAIGSAAAEYRPYIQRILDRSGIVNNVTPLNLGKCHTATHPLDPSIFYYLELFHRAATVALSRRCNRKLIFQLVDELLADILRSYFDFRPWISPVASTFSLTDVLCNRIEGFPAANCEVLEDIDSLIGKDLGKSQLIGNSEELEELVCKIEGEILDSLVQETAAMVAAGGGG